MNNVSLISFKVGRDLRVAFDALRFLPFMPLLDFTIGDGRE